jgi:hypothetical protein
MANQKYDGVIEAVHYTPDGQVDWVRAYLRRGPTWSDRIIMRRQDLIDEIKSGKRMMLGKRVQYMAGTFEVSKSIKIGGSDSQEYLFSAYSSTKRDFLEGAPVI